MTGQCQGEERGGTEKYFSEYFSEYFPEMFLRMFLKLLDSVKGRREEGLNKLFLRITFQISCNLNPDLSGLFFVYQMAYWQQSKRRGEGEKD